MICPAPVPNWFGAAMPTVSPFVLEVVMTFEFVVVLTILSVGTAPMATVEPPDFTKFTAPPPLFWSCVRTVVVPLLAKR